MQIRKLGTTAAGTYIVTIPKEWVQKLRLRKGDLVSLELEENDVVISSMKPQANPQSRSLEIEQFKDRKMLELCIIASYIQGHDVTRIVSKVDMSPEQKRWVRQALEGLIGVEIAEDYAKLIVLQNLVDSSKFDIDKLIERFSSTSLAVFQDGIRALALNDESLAQEAFERGEESARLYRLLMRLALQGIVSRKVRSEMNLSDIPSVIVRIIAIRELGRIAYYAMRIAQHVGELDDRPEESTISIIQRMTKITTEMQDQAKTALLNKDFNLASSIIDRMSEVRRLYETSHSSILKHKSEKTEALLSLIIRDIRAIAGYAVALADDAILGVFA